MMMALAIWMQEAELQKWIGELAHDEVEVREAATKALIESGARAIPAVKEALKSADDAEKKARLEHILSEIDPPACAQLLTKALALGGATKVKEGQKAVWEMLDQVAEICGDESGQKIGAKLMEGMNIRSLPWQIGKGVKEERIKHQILVADGNVEVTETTGCVILASGDVKIEKSSGCVVITRGAVEIQKISGGLVLAGGDFKGSLAYRAEVGAYGKVHGVKLSGGAALWGEGWADPWEKKGAEVRSNKVRLILKGFLAKP